MQTQLLTIQDVADHLNISRYRAYQIIRAGMIECVNIGRQIRVRPESLRSFVADGGSRIAPKEMN